MPRTPDRCPGASDEEGIFFEVASSPTQNGELRYTGTGLFFRHDDTNYDLLIDETGLSESQHALLRQLIHFLDSGPGDGFASGHEEVYAYDGIKLTSAIWYTDNTHSTKLYELVYTYSGILVATETAKMYDSDGSTVLAQAVDTYSYSGVFPTKRVRVITVRSRI
jgi:hypothetical protein